MVIGETANINFIVFGLIWPGIKPMVYHTQGEHAIHCSIYAAIPSLFTVNPRKHLLYIVIWNNNINMIIFPTNMREFLYRRGYI